MPFTQDFSKQIELLSQLFDSETVTQQLLRLEHIFEVSERCWYENLKRLDGQPINHILIAEVPPWTTSGEVAYFYNNLAGSWCGRILGAFGLRKQEIGTEACFDELAQAGFLLVDSLPFAMPYSTVIRKKPAYSDLIHACSDYLSKKLQHPSLSWAENPKTALAFKYNGLNLIKTHPDGLQLSNGSVIDLSETRIASDGSGFTNPNKLRAIWGID